MCSFFRPHVFRALIEDPSQVYTCIGRGTLTTVADNSRILATKHSRHQFLFMECFWPGLNQAALCKVTYWASLLPSQSSTFSWALESMAESWVCSWQRAGRVTSLDITKSQSSCIGKVLRNLSYKFQFRCLIRYPECIFCM